MWYDVVVLLILGLAIFRGAIKGFVWQLASIAALVLCFVFAERFSLAVAPYISVEAPLNRWIAMFALYVIFSFVSFAVARLLRGWIEKAKFVEYDRHLGSLFGFVKGATFCLVLTFFVVTLSERARAQVLESKSGYLAAVIMDRLHPMMPDELREVIEPYIHKLDRDDLDLNHSHHAATDGDDDHAQDPGEHQHGEIPAGEQKGSGEGSLADLMAKLPGVIDDELRQMVSQALEKTAPQDREELINKLSTGIPGLMRAVADDWKEGKPAESGPKDSERQSLLREIGAAYSDFPDAQTAIAREVESAVRGIPDGVVLAVLRDWHSDLLDRKPDPDPETDAGTSLDSRIVRQMGIASSGRWELPAIR